MNGYFNNLALRSMNAGNLVEPRLPSLFEPQRSEPDAATPVYSESRPVSVDAPSPTEFPRAKVSTEEPSVADNVAGPQSELRPAVTTARSIENSDEAPAPVVRSTHEDHTAPIAVAEQPTVPAETLSADQTAAQPKPVALQSAVESVRSVAPQLDKTLPSVAVTKIGSEPLPAPQSKIVGSETTSEVEEHVALVEEQEAFLEPPPILQTPALFKTEVKPHVVEHVIERSRNTDRTDFRSVTRSITNYAWRESEAAAPEPSINITIGRVEVRAAPATNTKPTRTRQESPVMPLDEYLRKQRRGGEQ